jgi:DNA-binding GntR family transcriptional regulator
MEVRAYLESLAYKSLHSIITRSQLAHLRRILRDMNSKKLASSSEMSEYVELHLSFHLALIEYAGNPLLMRLFRQLNFRSSNMLYFTMDEAVLRKTQAEHEQILDCLARHDPAGEDFMRGHILQSMEEHLKIWDDGRLPCSS